MTEILKLTLNEAKDTIYFGDKEFSSNFSKNVLYRKDVEFWKDKVLASISYNSPRL